MAATTVMTRMSAEVVRNLKSRATCRSAIATDARAALQSCDAKRSTPAAPILVFGIGNPSRGDDALGPLLIERLQRLQLAGRLAGVELLTDFQLQVEHVLDLIGRERVILVDAAVDLDEPYRLTPVAPALDPALSWTTHQLRPAALAQLCVSLYGDAELPRLEQLAIGAEAFELGAALSARAERNLSAASDWLLEALDIPPEVA